MERRELTTVIKSALMQSARWLGIGSAQLVCVLLLACQSSGPGSSVRDAPHARAKDSAAAAFSSPAAWQHLRALNKIGSRVSGSTNSSRSRQYLREVLGQLDIKPRMQRVSVVDASGKKIELTHVTAMIPGHSPDVLLLAAHYDTSRESSHTRIRRNDQRASGPALLLELARALHAGPTPAYTVWLSWIDGDALDAAPNGSSRTRLGAESLVEEWSRDDEFSRIRVAIFFGDVGDRDKPIVRDIDSPRVYREIFWQVAQDLGYGSSFPEDSGYGLSSTSRLTFAQANLRSSIALANPRGGTGKSLDESSRGTLEHTSVRRPPRPSAGFEAVGKVTLEALSRIAAKLHKIDQFAHSPLTAGREEAGRR